MLGNHWGGGGGRKSARRRLFGSEVKSWSSTPEPPFDTEKLESGRGEWNCKRSVEVKFVDIRKNTSGEGGSLARY